MVPRAILSWGWRLAPVHLLSLLFLSSGCINLEGVPDGGEQAEGQSAFTSADPSNGRWGDEPNAGYDDEDGSGDKSGEEREVEEADIYKVLGDTMLVLNQFRGLMLFDLSEPDSPRLLGRERILGYPVEMYVRDNRAYIVVSDYFRYWWYAEDGESDEFHGSQVVVVDISVPGNPQLLGSIELQGFVSDTRIVGDVLYTVSTRYAWYSHCGSEDSTDSTQIVSIDLSDPFNVREVDELIFEGTSWNIHVTNHSLYVAGSTWHDDGYLTDVTYVDISDPKGRIVVQDRMQVAGYVQGRWKMDEHEQAFRVVSYDWQTRHSTLTTFDVSEPARIKQMASLKFARNEQLFATRFDGEKAYFVTFERIDPLWVVDLADPAHPVMAGELEVPGWSTHIEPRGDRLIALGVDDQNGRRVSVSLYDVSEPARPTLMARESFGDQWSWSGANYDYKAFAVHDDLGLIVVPYTGHGRDDSGRYYYRDRIQLVDFGRDRLEARGDLTTSGQVLRTIPVGERLVSVSNEELKVIDASDRDNPLVTARVELARNVSDFAVMAAGFGVRASGNWRDENVKLTSVTLADPEEGPALGEVVLQGGWLQNMFARGDFVDVMSYRYDYETYVSTNVLTVVDFSDRANPRLRGTVELPNNGYWGYYRYWGYYGGYGGGPIQMPGDLLVLSTYYLPWAECDAVLGADGVSEAPEGEGQFYSGLIVIDLSDADNPTVAARIGIDMPQFFGMQAVGSVLHLSHAEPAGQDDAGRSIVRHYLDRFDLADPNNPVRLLKVNIPGAFVAASADGRYLYTVDTQYEALADGNYQYRSRLCALALIDGRAYLRDSLELPDAAGGVVVRGLAAYFQTYRWWYDEDQDGNAYGCWHNEYGIHRVNLADPRNLSISGSIDGPGYGWLAEATASRAFVNVGYGGIGVYDFSAGGNPRLESFNRTNGYVYKVVVNGRRAYLPLGYYGLQTLVLPGGDTGPM